MVAVMLILTVSVLMAVALCVAVLGVVLVQAHRGGDLVLSERNEARWVAAAATAHSTLARVRARMPARQF